jgi:prolyl oligopeptidase
MMTWPDTHPSHGQHARRCATALAVAALVGVGATTARAQTPVSAQTADTDPFIWLEQVSSDRAMSWVKAENARTLGVLENDLHFKTLYGEALQIAQASDRIPSPSIIGGMIYNFWQDADHAHGIWRRTTLASYKTRSPQWTTVLDLDALSKKENANWFWAGASCAEPAEQDCMISLSDGGEDAVTIREFDLKTSSFVRNGFVLPHGKQNITWESPSSLLVAREWEPGQLTASGYPFVVKRLTRGMALKDAKEVFRGAATDVSAGPASMHDGAGHDVMMMYRGVSFFETEQYVKTAKGFERIAIPLKANVQGLVAGHMLIGLDTAWNAGGKTYTEGSLLSVPLASLLAHPGDLHPTLVYQPGARESLNGITTTKDALITVQLDNVRGRAFVYRPTAAGTWTRKSLPLPDNSTIGIVDSDLHSNLALLSVTGFLTPSSIWQLNAQTQTLSTIKSSPSRFDASRDTVEQFEATSTDGTRIPYFVVHPRAMQRDGKNPTIIYAYGGFQASQTPGYSANVGKLWLERGGVWVLANIRGGNEFGPKWHEAGLKTHRQLIYDDFAAVGRDVVARGITDSEHLGIEGGSNGGLLMGVEFTQHPELWSAVDIQVPLLDMMRYEQIAAGASWVGEYGSVSVPEERAFLEKISPYNNIKTGVKYPEALIWTTTKDDRVGPQHARKFAAKLGSMNIPYLYYEVIEGGHGSGASLAERAHTTALEMTYFIRKLMKPVQ